MQLDFFRLNATKHMCMVLCTVLALVVKVLNLSSAGMPFLVWLVQNDTEQHEWQLTKRLYGQSCQCQAGYVNTYMPFTADLQETELKNEAKEFIDHK